MNSSVISEQKSYLSSVVLGLLTVKAFTFRRFPAHRASNAVYSDSFWALLVIYLNFWNWIATHVKPGSFEKLGQFDLEKRKKRVIGYTYLLHRLYL